MGYFWWGLAAFVHVHAVLLLIAILPIPTSSQWNWIINNCVVNFFAELIGVNTWGFYLAILCPCFIVHLDSLNDYWKYSSVDFELYENLEARKDARILLLLSQRNYYISGTAMILCILLPRLLSIRAENGRLSENTDSVLAKVIHELVALYRNANEAYDRGEVGNERRTAVTNEDKNDAMQVLKSIKKELEKLNEERERLGGHPIEAEELNGILKLYNTVRRQTRDAANNSLSNPLQLRQRLARSRLTSSVPIGNRTTEARRHRRYLYEFHE